MKLSFVICLLGLLWYVIAVPIHDALSLRQAVSAGEPDWARYYAERLHKDQPEFYADRARAVCSDRRIAQARRLMAETHVDYASVVGLAQIEKRCGASDRLAEAAQLLEALAAGHLARATALCRERHYPVALSEFEQLLTLSYPDHALARARSETNWCRLAYAKNLMEQGMYDTALGELHRAVTSADQAVQEAALHHMPAVVRQELDHWVERQQYALAFKRLGQRQDMFGGWPETASFFNTVAQDIEAAVFGMVLAHGCREPDQARPPQKGQKSPPSVAKAVTVDAPVGDTPVPSGGDNLIIQNDSNHVLQVLLRGPEAHDVRLEPHTTRSLRVAAGEYLVGSFSRQNCSVRARRTAWSITSAPNTHTFQLMADRVGTRYLHLPPLHAFPQLDPERR